MDDLYSADLSRWALLSTDVDGKWVCSLLTKTKEHTVAQSHPGMDIIDTPQGRMKRASGPDHDGMKYRWKLQGYVFSEQDAERWVRGDVAVTLTPPTIIYN